MSGSNKLYLAERLLQKAFGSAILQLEFHPTLPYFKLTMRTNVRVYIRYNNFNEYSYQIIYSEALDDSVRFDNYDDLWPVTTRPHHFHPKEAFDAIESPMNGDPDHDMKLLIPYIKDDVEKHLL